MKTTQRNLRSSVVSVLVLLCMLFSIMAPTVMAVDSAIDDNTGAAGEKETIKYVSIGDSMTNGYGLDGYDGNSGAVNYAKETYTNQFAAWLAGYEGKIVDDQVIFDGDKAIVDHRQLAMSGLRAEDLHWLLELDYENEELMQTIYERWYNVDRTGSNWVDKVSELWYGEWGFKTGDYRTWTDFCDGDYRYGDAAARILATYHGNVNNARYFQSSYATDEAVQNAINGVNSSKYFPNNKTQVDRIGGHKYLQIATEFYQKSVAEADIISLALGNTNFGTYMLAAIMDVVMEGDTTTFNNNYNIDNVFALADLDPEIETLVRDLIAQCDGIINQYFGGLAGGDEAKAQAIKDVLIYCVVSYIVNYIGSVEAIVSLNPDAEIIQIALLNAYTVESEDVDGMTLGDLVATLYAPINTFIAAVPACLKVANYDLYKNATFYYAEAGAIGCMVDVFGDDYYKKDGEFVKYDGILNGTEEGYEANYDSIVRERFFSEIVGSLFNLLSGYGLTKDFTLEEVFDYELMTIAERAEYAAKNSQKAMSIAFYLAFENAHIVAGKGTVTMDSLASLGGGFNMELFADAIVLFRENVAVKGKDYIAVVTQTIADTLNAGINNSGKGFVGTATAADILSVYLAADKDAAAYAVALAIAKHEKNAATIEALAKEGVYAQITDETYQYYYNQYAAANSVPYTWEQFKTYGGDNYTQFVAGVKANAWAAYKDTALATAYDTAAKTLAGYVKTAESNVGNLCYLLALPQTLSEALVYYPDLAGVLCMNARCIVGTGIGGHPSTAGHVTMYNAIVDTYKNGYTSTQKTLENVIDLVLEYYDDAFKLAYDYAEKQGYIAMVVDTIDGVIAELEAIKAELIPDSVVRAVAASSEQSALEELTEALIKVIDEAIVTLNMMAEVIENGDVSSFEALAATLNELVVVFSEQMETIVELAVQVGVVVSERFDEIVEEVEEIIRDFVEEIIEIDYAEIAIRIFDYIVANFSDVAADVYDYLINNPEEVIDFIVTYGEEIKDLLDENSDVVIEVLTYIYDNYGKAAIEYVMENKKEVLLALADLVEEYGDEAWALVELYAEATGLTAEIKNALTAAKAEVEALIPVLEAQLEVLRAELEYAAGEAQAAIEAKIAEVEAKIAEAKAALAEIYAEIEKVVAKVNAVNNAVVELAKKLCDAANGAIADLANAVNNAKAAFEALVAEVEADVEAKIEALVNKVAALATDVAEKLDALTEAVKEYVAEAEAEMTAKAEAALAAIEAAKAALKSDVIEAVELVKTTAKEVVTTVKEAYDYAKLAVEYLVWNATNAYYMADEDSYYVAIGDGVSANDPQTMKDTYVDILADALGLDYKNLSKAGLTPDATLALIAENLDVIAKADIITLNYSNSELLPFALGNLEVAAFDWSFLGENANEYVDQILAKVSELMAENGIDLGAMSAKIENVIEAVAYYYAVRVAYYPVVVNEIHKVAPDALVVLVGAYNDLAGCAIELEGTTIAIGEYLQYIINALNLESFVIAALDERAVYVDIDGVETELDGATQIEEMLEYLVGNEPTEAGHDYIAAAILRAINVEICEEGEHVYDNDCDEYCNVCGARRDAKAHVYSSICDENCNVCDAFNEDAAAHTYYNACDAECNVCGKTREVGAHEYTADCDAYCNICGGKRDAAAHAWGEWVVEEESTTTLMGKRVRTCAKCGASTFELIPVIAEEAEAEGLSTGAVVAIVTVPSVFGLGLGGFAIFWFAYKKKSFADLKNIIMALFKKA